MISIPYTDRDYESIFNDIKKIAETIEPKLSISQNKANIETILTKIIAGCVDTLSFNQDANILEAFPSTSKDNRSTFDLLSIVGYTPKTARCCHLYMTLWDPNFIGEVTYSPFNKILIEGKRFYCPDSFRCAQGVTTTVEWYQGILRAPDKRPTQTTADSFIKNYYPNISINTITNRMFKLPEKDNSYIDSKTIRVYDEKGQPLTFVENPYMTNITKRAVSIIPNVTRSGYSLIFSKDVAEGNIGDNFYAFYVISENSTIGKNLKPDFSNLKFKDRSGSTISPTFSFNYDVDDAKEPETAAEARKNVIYEFGWRDTPNAIITRYDAERAVLQNFKYISAVCVKDGNNYSKCDPSLLDIQIFCKVNEDYEDKLDVAVVEGFKNRLLTHFNKFKMLPLNYTFHIDNVATTDDEQVTQLYMWYPNVTIYLKEKANLQDATLILNNADAALRERYKTINVNYNEVPRVVDIIDAIQNSSDKILYLDVDGINYRDGNNNSVSKEDITCEYKHTLVTYDERDDYDITLDTKDQTRCIEYHTVKLVDNFNEVLAYDSGDGVLINNGNYLKENGEIDYKTGKIHFKLNDVYKAQYDQLHILYKLETPTFCEYITMFDTPGQINQSTGMKIALESLKGAWSN